MLQSSLTPLMDPFDVEMPYEIVRWDTHLNNKNLTPLKKHFIREYDNNHQLRNTINKTIEYFLDRKNKAGKKNHLQYGHCLNYLIEECPVIMMLWAQQGYDYIAYPNKMTPAMQYCREQFVQPYLPDKVNWLSLKFKKKILQGGI